MPLFFAKTPGNVNAFAEFFDTLISFDFIDVEDLTEKVVYIPEKDPYSLNF